MAIRQRRLFPLKDITNMSRQFDPVSEAGSGAAAYQAEQGKKWSTTGLGDIQRDRAHGHGVYLAYRNAMGAPEKKGLRASYEAMGEHVGRQYEYLTRPASEGGMGITHEVTAHDPYATPQEMAEDLRTNRRIKTFSSETTGPHEHFSFEQNDQFRAVHDVFGHASIGRGFSAHGEEAAFLAHRQMFPPEAHAALASETRGQNSYLNYSGTNSFPSQEGRIVGLPDWAASKRQHIPAERKKLKPQGTQLSLF